MRTLWKLGLAAACAAGLARAAVAAGPGTHVINVALPDGSVARVQYVGDVAPRVTIAPAVPIAVPGFGLPPDLPMPAFAGMFEQMDREMAATMHQIDQLARQPLPRGAGANMAGANLAGYGSAPVGSSSYSVVTVSENGHQCSRSTRVIGQGAGKPPKVVENVSGDCSPAKKGAAAVPAPTGPVHQS